MLPLTDADNVTLPELEVLPLDDTVPERVVKPVDDKEPVEETEYVAASLPETDPLLETLPVSVVATVAEMEEQLVADGDEETLTLDVSDNDCKLEKDGEAEELLDPEALVDTE